MVPQASFAFALVLVLVSPGVARGEPPPGLACAARVYGVRAAASDGRWFAELPDGTRVPWDDGRVKTFDEKLDAPDVEDMFSQPYEPGPICPVTIENQDPGRIRVDALFKAAYPAAGLKKGTFRGQPVRVHEKVAAALAGVEKRLADADPKYLVPLGGTYHPRVIAGTRRKSAHAYGVAIDLNPKLSHYWRWAKRGKWDNRIPQAIVDAFEAEGFIWGGRWFHFDTMHFEFRPELLDPACSVLP